MILRKLDRSNSHETALSEIMFLLLLFATALAYPMVLDIGDEVDPREVAIAGRGTPELQYLIFTPKSHVDVIKVIRGSEFIWEGQKGERCLSISISKVPRDRLIASARIANESTCVSHVYFYFNEDKWENVDCGRYHDILFGLTADAIFDLGTPVNERKFLVREYNPFYHPSYIYTPRFNYYITSVVYNDQVLWKSPSENDRCEKIVFHGIRGYLEYVHLLTQEGPIYVNYYFEKVADTWVPLSKTSFFKNIERLSITEDTKL